MWKITTNNTIIILILSFLLYACKEEEMIKEIIPDSPSIENTLLNSYFSWDNNLIKLEDTNRWGLTFSPERITITNLPEKKQYLLSWQGGLSEGVKTNGTLKIIENGKLTQTISLTRISVVELKAGYYTILFNKNHQTGEVIFTK